MSKTAEKHFAAIYEKLYIISKFRFFDEFDDKRNF